MKKFRLSGIGVSAAALLLLAGCDEGMYQSSGTGTIAPVVTYDATVIGSRSAGSRAEFSDLTVNDLTLSLSKADGSFSVEFPYDEFPLSQEFTVGKYTLTAAYGNPEEEGFEAPAVFGSTELAVTEGKSTRVELVAKPSKAMVGIKFDESLLNYMSDVTASVRTAYNTIAYSIDETRCVYTKPGQVAVDVTFTKPNGIKGELEAVSFQAQAQNRYNITVKLGGNGAGAVEGITVIYEDATTEEVVDLDISDEVLTIPAPEVTLTGAQPQEVLYTIEGSALQSSPVMKINARGKIKSALLATTGSLTEKGWPEQIDLASASASQLSALEDMGLKGATTFRNGSKFAAVDFTNVAKHIDATGENADPVMFSLTVTDANGKVSDPVGFGIKVDKLVLNLSAIEGVEYKGGPTVDVQMEYNGLEPLADVVTVQYLSESGTFHDATIANVVAASRAMGVYTVSINVPDDAQLPLVFKAKVGNVVTDEIEVPVAETPVLAVNGNDVFARSLWASLSGNFDFANLPVQLLVSTDGVNFHKATGTQSGADYHITGGLTPATAYKVRAIVGDYYSNVVNVTTEAAAQIPNSDMDTWTTSTVSAGAYSMTNYAAAAPWATLNDLTVSQPNALDGRSLHVATVGTDDAHSNQAAVVRTVGWKATGSTPYNKQPENHTAGELYIGSYSGGAQYGMEFASRPSALKFWYKFSEFNGGDKGLVEIEVLDAAGNTIAKTSETYGKADAYQQAEVKLSYARNSAKAASLRVKFRSSDKATVSSADVAKLSTGLFTNHNQHATGASFYVDDVELVY